MADCPPLSLEAIETQERFQALLIERGARELADLIELKRKGWNDERLDQHFAQQRRTALDPGLQLELTWFRRMKLILKEIDEQTSCIPHKGKLFFLDLGCSPGGFSSYVLQRNPEAQGLGMSLETENGGHNYRLEYHLRRRHQLVSSNLTYFQLGPIPIQDTRLQLLPDTFIPRGFDLCLLDAHQLRGQLDSEKWDGRRLAISQLILALNGVKHGGNIIMKLAGPERLYSATILWMFDRISRELHTCKPLTMHANRGSFYAIAVGVGCEVESSKLPAMLDGLQKLWVELTFGGEEGRGRWMEEGDLDFLITEDALVDTFTDRLIELGRSVWLVQTQALSRLVSKSWS